MSLSRRELLSGSLAFGALGFAALRDGALARVAAAQEKVGRRSAEELAADEDFWIEIQQAYTVDRSLINLNNGGVSPSPRIVQEAQRRYMEFAQCAPSRNLWQLLDPQVETVRGKLARTFGCSPDEMAITRNASEALQICIYGMDMKPGDEVVTTKLDYPRMIQTYRQREQREGIKLNLVPVPTPVEDPAQVVEAFRAALTDRTRVMLVSHVVFLTGQINPVREICRLGRERNIPVIVDGAHAFAHIPFLRDDLECDYYGNSLHKWTCAAHGAGFLYVSKQKIATLWPMMAAPEPRGDNIRKFEEIGTHPAANRLAVAEALNFHNAIGIERKSARLRYLRDRWARRLMQDARVKLFTRLEPEHSCAISTMAIDGVDSHKLTTYLWDKHKIIVVFIDTENIRGIRVSPNVYTTPDEIDVFCSVIEGVLANGLPT